ncbi:MAG TPA: hypothetical protein VJ696_09340 [Rhodanobacteraceae bacterium]|nr:hypothetical protein [Rhodanobacteraceae bacterium]
MQIRQTAPLAFVVAAALLAACSDKSSTPPPQAGAPQQPAANPQAAKSLAMYRELLKSSSYELAGPIGQEIVANYPGTPEANEVNQTLADTVAKGTAIAGRRRLEKLWIYQTGTESGGEQSTASIYASQPATPDRVRLILRRHSQWGESVYLFGSGKGFDCGKACTIPTRFDDDPPQKLKAYSPATGEPAVFITDDHAFIAKMAKAQKVSFDVGIKGKGPATLVFETGGYDAAKFAPLAKPKK